jgi:hypothetical protein
MLVLLRHSVMPTPQKALYKARNFCIYPTSAESLLSDVFITYMHLTPFPLSPQF